MMGGKASQGEIVRRVFRQCSALVRSLVPACSRGAYPLPVIRHPFETVQGGRGLSGHGRVQPGDTLLLVQMGPCHTMVEC
jgi:hypothetical protein